MNYSKLKIQNLKLAAFLLLAACFLLPAAAQAKPERMPLKDPVQRREMKTARQSLNQVDLGRVQDPEARRALHQIVRYLNAQDKKSRAPRQRN